MPNKTYHPSLLCKLLIALALAGLFSGCSVATPAPTISQIERSGLDVVLVGEGQRAAFFKDGGTFERFCAAPESDVADVYGSGVSLGASEGSIEEALGFSRSESAVALGGRNPATLLTRELLYRACEMSLNINADGPTTEAIYDRFLKAILEITAQQKSGGSGTAAVASGTSDAGSSSETGSSSDGASDDDEDEDGEDEDDDGGVAG